MANQYDTNLKLQAIADAIGDTQSSGLIQALEDIADAVAGGGGGGSSTAGLVSDNFSETDTYDLGDYCIHNNTLYVCINAITTPGAWDLSDWQATNAGLQLSSLNSAITDMRGRRFARSINVNITNAYDAFGGWYESEAVRVDLGGDYRDKRVEWSFVGTNYDCIPIGKITANEFVLYLLRPTSRGGVTGMLYLRVFDD